MFNLLTKSFFISLCFGVIFMQQCKAESFSENPIVEAFERGDIEKALALSSKDLPHNASLLLQDRIDFSVCIAKRITELEDRFNKSVKLSGLASAVVGGALLGFGAFRSVKVAEKYGRKVADYSASGLPSSSLASDSIIDTAKSVLNNGMKSVGSFGVAFMKYSIGLSIGFAAFLGISEYLGIDTCFPAKINNLKKLLHVISA